MSLQNSILLISGTSHAGKSTFAKLLFNALGRDILSTDQMARHPGRPWPHPKPHVYEYYSKLSDESVYQFLLNHYENMRPRIVQTISEQIESGRPLVLEGSALRPEYMVQDFPSGVEFVCLYCDEGILRERIFKESQYQQLDDEHKLVVERFIARTLRDNEMIKSSAESAGVACLNSSDEVVVQEFVKKIREEE